MEKSAQVEHVPTIPLNPITSKARLGGHSRFNRSGFHKTCSWDWYRKRPVHGGLDNEPHGEDEGSSDDGEDGNSNDANGGKEGKIDDGRDDGMIDDVHLSVDDNDD